MATSGNAYLGGHGLGLGSGGAGARVGYEQAGSLGNAGGSIALPDERERLKTQISIDVNELRRATPPAVAHRGDHSALLAYLRFAEDSGGPQTAQRAARALKAITRLEQLGEPIAAIYLPR